MKGITFVLAILDMSGSMGTLACDVRDGFNEFIKGLRASEGPYRVTTVLFDDKYQVLCSAAPLDAVPELNAKNYAPRGMTALLDAIGRTIDDFERSAQLGADDRVLVFVQTDGHENFSRQYTAEAIRKMIVDRELTERWSFQYIGSHPDVWGQAGDLGFRKSSVNASNATGLGTRLVYRGMTESTVAYASGASGEAVSQILTASIAQEAKDKENNS